jgi:hypothetical protein
VDPVPDPLLLRKSGGAGNENYRKKYIMIIFVDLALLITGLLLWY